MRNIEYTETVRGYRIDIIREDGGDCPSPRGDCQNGIMLTRESRDYNDPDAFAWREITGQYCHFPPTITCPCGYEQGCHLCEADTREAATWAEVVKWATDTYGATTVLPLDGPNDHAGRYTDMSAPGTGIWTRPDTTLEYIDGVIFDTADRRTETGTTADQMVEALRGELAEYNAWADGYVYEYRITDCNGIEIESCGFMISPDGPESYPLEEARMAVPDTECVRTYPVRLSADQWGTVASALEMYPLTDDDRINGNLQAAIDAVRATGYAG